MKRNLGRILALAFCAGLTTISTAPSRAQSSEVKEKTAMYTYVAFWGIPRAQWADFEKQEAANQKVMEKAVSDGSLVGFGSDQNLIHSQERPSHDTWFSSMSMAGLFNTLDRMIVPILEKMLADGIIHEYEIDTEAIHTDAPGTFFIEYIATNAEGLDR